MDSLYKAVEYIAYIGVTTIDLVYKFPKNVNRQLYTVTNGIKAYFNIERDLVYFHRTVNHSLNFVDKVTGVYTQAIESYWNKNKLRIKRMTGCKREFLYSYSQEFKFTERNRYDMFNQFSVAIADKYIFH